MEERAQIGFDCEDLFVKTKKSKKDSTTEHIWDYYKDISRYPLLTPEQEQEFYNKIYVDKDKDAKRQFICHNLRFVVYVIHNFLSDSVKKCQSMDIMDLIMAGNIGLMKAVDKFDPSKGYKFSTYAIWWIRTNILRTISQEDSIIRLPQRVYDDIRVITRHMHKKEAELGRDLFQSERKQIIREYVNGYENQLVIEQAIYVIATESLDREIPRTRNNIVGNYTVADFIPSNDPTPEQVYEAEIQTQEIDHALSTLSERERYVIERRFGFVCDNPATLEDIGVELNVSRERIRQIEAKSMRRLSRSSTIRKKLVNFAYQ